MKIAYLCWQTFSCAARCCNKWSDGVLLLMVERSLTLTLKAHLSCLLAHASNKWLLSGSNIILSQPTQDLSGCARLRATTNIYAQQVLAERMESSVLCHGNQRTSGSENFHHFTLCAVQNCSLCQLRREMTCHTGIRTWSHRRHHVMSNVLPGCTHHCCHFPH